MPHWDLTDEEKRTIKGAIRRAFRQSKRMHEVLNSARVELPPALKKDGTPRAKNQVRFKCAVCGNLFPRKWVAVDHINPVVPLNKNEKDMTPNELVDGIFCDSSNLQVICTTPIKFLPKGEKSCHTKKSAEENWIRKNITMFGGSVDEWAIKYKEYLIEKENKKLTKKSKSLKRLKKLKKR